MGKGCGVGGFVELNINAALIFSKRATPFRLQVLGAFAFRSPALCAFADRPCPLALHSTKAVKRFAAPRLLTWIYPGGFTKL